MSERKYGTPVVMREGTILAGIITSRAEGRGGVTYDAEVFLYPPGVNGRRVEGIFLTLRGIPEGEMELLFEADHCS